MRKEIPRQAADAQSGIIPAPPPHPRSVPPLRRLRLKLMAAKVLEERFRAPPRAAAADDARCCLSGCGCCGCCCGCFCFCCGGAASAPNSASSASGRGGCRPRLPFSRTCACCRVRPSSAPTCSSSRGERTSEAERAELESRMF
ncbi:hypothetical protein TSOC_008519 [Tetrabaena socialis]|uniref:Uncharacterized protein n=1 Tax=Tetrabaena socialis TaxID=47790 RepID=A0A2J7ZY96_9CHLO|nr:hypothetical protein TSOC_008519 [Tetrabaena socialis]|eukprot:PNH05237.1 hypothetical protein TSOC_008519 [Tetrabaena socialis]